jgi:hypothetical protein
MGMTGTVEVEVKGKKYRVQISPPGPMVPVEELEKALIANRKQLKEAQAGITATFKKEVFEMPAPKFLNYESPTLLGIMAHLNINVLVPIINMKGGSATFQKPETMPVDKHLEKMYFLAQKGTLENFHKEQRPFHTAFIVSFLLLIIIFAILL